MATVKDTETELAECLRLVREWRGRGQELGIRLSDKHWARLDFEAAKPAKDRHLPVTKNADGTFNYLGAKWR